MARSNDVLDIDSQLAKIKEGFESSFHTRLAPYLELIQSQARLIRTTVEVLANMNLSPDQIEVLAENWFLTGDWVRTQALSEKLGFDVVNPVLVEEEEEEPVKESPKPRTRKKKEEEDPAPVVDEKSVEE